MAAHHPGPVAAGSGAVVSGAFEWTGLGCDVCGFGSVEDIDRFDPKEPCPECGSVMLPQETDNEDDQC